MRVLRRAAAAVLVLSAAVISPSSAAAIAAPDTGTSRTPRPARPDPGREPWPPYRAECRTRIEGSRAVVACHNPYPESDLVQLHIECDRWWDPDVDGKPVDVGPARTVELADRCWMDIRAVWVTHTPAPR
ncbi:hypothetical protein [Streptomyces sp. bgisy100]|uniref:hypothetical protein n=1 Tax=Streptomyces sp. bgisy100 TaxID=3413783 RepID=UPI003D7473BE